jgi:hypothetical protein
MHRTAELAARLRDLERRSQATDRAADAALEDLKAAGAELADAMAHLVEAIEAA